MIGRLLSFWGPAHFQVRTASFREGIFVHYKPVSGIATGLKLAPFQNN